MSEMTLQSSTHSAIEHDILQIIAENPEISQRKIAEATGISLGQANFLMKKFLKKGLIKIEGQSSKSLKYNLTPKGLKEKMETTLWYVKASYAALVRLTDKITEMAEEYKSNNSKIYIINQQDEMTEIVQIALDRISAEYRLIQDISEINAQEGHVLLIWEDQKYPNIKSVNVLA